MKIGVCTSPDKMQLAAELGYDYIEPNFSWMTGLDDQAFAELTAIVQASPIKAESFCIFFPGGSKLYALDGHQAPLLERIAAFAEKGFSRAAMWGGPGKRPSGSSPRCWQFWARSPQGMV